MIARVLAAYYDDRISGPDFRITLAVTVVAMAVIYAAALAALF